MKKLLSVLLTVVMLLGCASVAFADGETITLTNTTNDGTLEYTDATIIIPAGVVFTNTGTIRLHRGSFVVNAGGTFDNKGSFIVDDYTAVTVKGTFNNYITLPGSTSVTYAASTPTFDRNTHVVNFEYGYLLKSAMSADDDYLTKENYHSGSEIPVPYGDTLYIMITAKEGSKDVNYLDTSRIQLWGGTGSIINSSAVDNTRRGIFVVTPKSAASYSPVSLKYADLVTQFDIELPAKEGVYTVKTDKGETGHAIVNYGELLTVTVELEPDYDESEISMYISGIELKPDKYGYYDINTVYADDGTTLIVNSKNGTVSQDGVVVTTYGIRAPFSMIVMGAMKNETKQKFTNVLSYLRQIFEVFMEIFNSLKESLGGLFG